MKTNVCTYCGGTLSPADYHVVGIDSDHANILSCVTCWRRYGLVTTRLAPITTTTTATAALTTTAQGRLL
ncbi:hypothetical protein [Candidatus Amarolinea dominans]|uniref:hypothetical protein n=1 Tax=Candidatus Amarolinea dominans TaxID=3140696 RepID=UPI0031371771|nr:hypothetical protein [Anaerolineae bacterium]